MRLRENIYMRQINQHYMDKYNVEDANHDVSEFLSKKLIN